MLQPPRTEPVADIVPAHAYAPRVPLIEAAALQVLAAVAAALLLALAPAAFAAGAMAFALLQGALAATFARLRGADAWWLLIHALFAPGLVWALRLDLPPAYALVAFCLLASLNWGALRNRVPLFLSSRAAVRALAELLPAEGSFSFVDLGCGTGGVLAALARARPQGRYYGVESAPLSFALAWLRALRRAARCGVGWGDFAALDLRRYDVVYAYLSPAAMPALWQKARREMRRGSVLISNSFAVAGVPPTASVAAGGTQLLLWRM